MHTIRYKPEKPTPYYTGQSGNLTAIWTITDKQSPSPAAWLNAAEPRRLQAMIATHEQKRPEQLVDDRGFHGIWAHWQLAAAYAAMQGASFSVAWNTMTRRYLEGEQRRFPPMTGAVASPAGHGRPDQRRASVAYWNGHTNIAQWFLAWLHESIAYNRICIEGLNSLGDMPETTPLVGFLWKGHIALGKKVWPYVPVHGYTPNELRKHLWLAGVIVATDNQSVTKQVLNPDGDRERVVIVHRWHAPMEPVRRAAA